MKILKSSSPMILGELSSHSSGIYKEVEESKIPKQYIKDLSDLRGCGVKADKYYRSNTNDETLYKYFEKVAEIVKFEPIHDLTFKKLNDSISFKENLKILKKVLNDDSVFTIKSYLNDVKITYTVPKESLKAFEHEYIEYKDFFLGREEFNVTFSFVSDDKELFDYVNSINEKIKFSELAEIENVINKVNIKKMWVSYSKHENVFFEGNKL